VVEYVAGIDLRTGSVLIALKWRDHYSSMLEGNNARLLVFAKFRDTWK
jgi:hypothetical protein